MADDQEKKKTRSEVKISKEQKEYLIRIGKRITELRKKKTLGESYEVFAVKNGINRISQFRMERGENFMMVNLLKVCEGLDITLEEFFEGV